MIIKGTKDIGSAIKKTRKAHNMTQAELAVLCGVGTRFIVELEQGKETAMLGKALQVLQKLGLEITFTNIPGEKAPQVMLQIDPKKQTMWAAYTLPWPGNK